MFSKLKKWWLKLNDRSNDPVYSCEVYNSQGCSHVDGFLCDMATCDILKKHKLESGYFRLQINPEIVVCLDGSDVHGWIFYRHPDGQLVTKRKLADWELMQAEDQRDENIVINAEN